LLSVLASIPSDDIMKTIILAGIGAMVSFLVSLGIEMDHKKNTPWPLNQRKASPTEAFSLFVHPGINRAICKSSPGGTT